MVTSVVRKVQLFVTNFERCLWWRVSLDMKWEYLVQNNWTEIHFYAEPVDLDNKMDSPRSLQNILSGLMPNVAKTLDFC